MNGPGQVFRHGTLCVALLATLALAACETPGKVGEASIFDASTAAPDDIDKALRRDGRVVLRGVLFETDSARLSDAGKASATRIAQVMEDDSSLKIAIVGHTDSTGDFRYNLDLSRRRAEALSRELSREGVAADRVAPVGVGEIAPVSSNETSEGRALNRRVEVVLIE